MLAIWLTDGGHEEGEVADGASGSEHIQLVHIPIEVSSPELDVPCHLESVDWLSEI
jgi:hypothetical protein